ncbi:MAG TPA: PilZ domain-containing protein [Thermoanaerobaculia bacterium]
MKKPDEQQRNAERIPLKEPITGTIDSAEAHITELSLIGAKVEHFNRLSMNSNATVQFRWRNQNIKLRGKVARTEMRSIRGKPGYMSGITFANTLEEAPKELRWMMAGFVEPIEPAAELEELAPPPPPPPAPAKPAPKPVARPAAKPAAPPPPPKLAAKRPATTPLPIPAPFLQQEEDEIEEIDADAEVPPYVECAWIEERWVTRRTNDPKQPMSGFTMLAPETDEEIDDFCRTYAMADPETQRMIRLSFELSIAQQRRG